MELKTPIRLYWDVSPPPTVPLDYLDICEQIVEARFLSLDLTVATDDLQTVGQHILKQLTGSSLSITLTVPSEALPLLDSNDLLPANVRTVLVQASSLAQLPAVSPPLFLLESGIRWGVSYPVSGGSWHELPDVVQWCAERTAGLLVLPMQRLAGNEEPYHLSREHRQTLISGLSAVSRPAGLSIIIHDPFLWRVFFPDMPFPEGRCQGANTLLYIASNGTVLPCPTFPYSLGDLRESSMNEIVRGERKITARKLIRSLPTDCRSCSEAALCGGGCRGRGFAVAGSWDKLDPGCR